MNFCFSFFIMKAGKNIKRSVNMQSTTTRLPKFSIEKLSPVTMCSERNPGFSGGIWSEMSPVVLRLPEGRVAMVSTNKSGAYRMRDGKTFMDFRVLRLLHSGDGQQREL